LINTEYRGRVSHRELHGERGGGIQKNINFSVTYSFHDVIFSYIFLILESIQLFIFCNVIIIIINNLLSKTISLTIIHILYIIFYMRL
jgi:hypothetical protein